LEGENRKVYQELKESAPMEAKADLNSVYSPSKDVVARDVHGEFIIIPITSGICELDDEIFSLNEAGKAIWSKLDGRKSLKEIAGALASEFDDSAAEIESDVLGLVKELLNRKMLVKL
jgi:hypothetical protein